MARIITFEELVKAEEETGWIEQICVSEDDTQRMSILYACVYGNHYRVPTLDQDWWKDAILENYNKIIKPSHEEYLEFFDCTDKTLPCGLRIWNSKPTEEEMKNVAWEVKE